MSSVLHGRCCRQRRTHTFALWCTYTCYLCMCVRHASDPDVSSVSLWLVCLGIVCLSCAFQCGYGFEICCFFYYFFLYGVHFVLFLIIVCSLFEYVVLGMIFSRNCMIVYCKFNYQVIYSLIDYTTCFSTLVIIKKYIFL